MSQKDTAPRKRRYRRHWWFLRDKILVGLLGLAIVVGACWVIGLSYAPWLPVLGLLPLGWLICHVVRWHTEYLQFEHNRLVFHRRPFDAGEYINYNFADWQFNRNLWAKMWNYGTLKIGSHHTFENFWPFRQLVQALRMSLAPAAKPSRPAAKPSPRPATAPAQPAAPGQPIFVFIPIRERVVVRERVVERPRPEPPTLPPSEGDGYIYNGIPFEANHPSYAGFLAACEAFLLPTGRLDLNACVSSDPRRRYYRRGMSREVALFYRELLQRTHIIDDRDLLFSRIHSVDDILQRVPYFEVPRRLMHHS
jgi:hypothetical protein